MNIAFFASCLAASCLVSQAAHLRSMLRALHARGHRISFHEADTPSVLLDTLERTRGADLVVKVGGSMHDPLLHAAVLGLQAPSRPVLFWDLDAPSTLARIADHPQDPLCALLARYDKVLTLGGGEPVRQAYRAAGVRGCLPICHALDPRTHFPVERRPAFDSMLGFRGDLLPDNEDRIDEFFLRAAAQLPMHRMLLAGSGWHARFMSPNVQRLGPVGPADHNAFNSSPRTLLQVSPAGMARYGFAPPAQLFEGAGAAACQICDDWPGLEAFFEPGKEVLVARNGDEVASHVDRLSASAARKIGRAAHARALAQHTYAHRAAQFDAMVEGRGLGRSAEISN